MRLVDVHCHLNSPRLPASPAALAQQARDAGVDTIVMAGVRPSGWAQQRELVSTLHGVHAVYGLHPWLAAEMDQAELLDTMATLKTMARATPRPVAIGETGVDGYTKARRAALGRQVASMRLHLALADRLGLPVVLHILKAHDRALAVLRDTGPPTAGGVIHSFSGSAEIALEYVRLGFHISFCGSLTNPQSRKLRRAAVSVPPSRLLIETDAPDQTPHPHKGQVNRPANLPLVAAALAEARGVALADIAETTTRNACALFGLE